MTKGTSSFISETGCTVWFVFVAVDVVFNVIDVVVLRSQSLKRREELRVS